MAREYMMQAETITVRSTTDGFEVDRHLPGGAVGETLVFKGAELMVFPGPEIDRGRRPKREPLEDGHSMRVHSDGTRFQGALVEQVREGGLPTDEQRVFGSLPLPEPAIVFAKG